MLNRIYIIAREYAENSGSYANFIEELSRYASSKGCRIVILCGAGIEKHGIETVSYGEIHRFRFPKIKLPLLGMNLDYAALALHTWNFFRKNKPTENDIIIANGRAALGVLKRRYVLRAGQPAFTFLTNMEIAKGEVSLVTRIARFVHFTIQAVPECLCMRYATACLFPSEETMNLWTKHYKSGKKPSFIPFAGVRFSKMDGGRKLPIEGRTILFISAGTERIRKGVMHLERALPGIFTRFEDARLIQVGEKMEWNVPKEYAGRITATGRISWNGMKDYYKTAGLMVSCALNEGFPNTILEAMAAGTPIVSSDINGITDYIT
ncbi:MAG: glycosyltransferase family 4 protein, partial [Candidatus Altiarchaeota archaeon]|nr:glycosyltransferase family 4 protein [Candidatus Altiarchaeota archaeon]